MWKQFNALGGGVLVVGHGTRVARGAEQLRQLAGQIHTLLGDIPTEASFLELSEPTIVDAMVRLRARGVRQVLVVPILLFEAGHARSDIPDAVSKAADELGLLIAGQSAPLGTHPAAIELSEYRFLQALRCRQSKGCLQAGDCSQAVDCFSPADREQGQAEEAFFHGRIGLAMVGRGTSDGLALEHMLRFTRIRLNESRIRLTWVETGFFAGGQPTLDDLMHQALVSNCETLVVQPHLLFEGQLIEQLREKVADCMRISPNQRWLVTPVLGADPKLAKAFFVIAGETLRESLSAMDTSI